jgi:hypothetical protein
MTERAGQGQLFGGDKDCGTVAERENVDEHHRD